MLITHSAQDLQRQTLLSQFSSACSDFGLIPSSIKIDGKDIENAEIFVYLGSSIASNASINTEINCCISKASSTFARLTARVWDNPKLCIRTKSNVYCSCVCSTLIYGSKTLTLSSVQEKKINTFHLRCLRRILKIQWQQKYHQRGSVETYWTHHYVLYP